MCGRYGFIPKKDFFERFNVDKVELEANTNTSPGQIMPVIIRQPYSAESYEGHFNKIVEMRWGLVPFWAKDPKIGYNMFNARAEDIDIKPSFREPFKSRRCLVPVNYFYEWDEKKKPHIFKLKDEEYFALAGLWDTTNTYTIITTEPNELVRQFHNRMPVVLKKEDEESWLNEGGKELLKPFESEMMVKDALKENYVK